MAAGLRRLELQTFWGPLVLAGGSRAGEGTVVLLPQLRLALDGGRPHRSLVPMGTLFLSHLHLDHAGALGYWLSQRFLNALPAATLLVPVEVASEVQQLVALHARLEGGRPYAVEIVAVADQSRHRLRADVDMTFFATDHWVPTLGAALLARRRRLRPELAGLPREEIVRRRLRGEEVSLEEHGTLLAYCADTGPSLLDHRPDLLAAEVLLLECSFVRSTDRDRARQYGHLHLDDLVSRADRLRCRHLVLLHGSRRDRLRDIEAEIAARLAPLLEGTVDHLMVDWD